MIGDVTLKKVYRDSTCEFLLQGSCNRIMTESKARIVSALTWPDTNHSSLIDPIVGIRFGSGGMNGLVPKKLYGTEEDLFAPILAGYSTSAFYTNRPKIDLSKTYVTYGYTLDYDELDTQAISEVGLFTSSGKLFSMKTFDEITKDTSFALVLSWRIRLV